VTRIIAGEAGSLRLATPGATTRPTSDRVREAMFSALDARIDFDDLRVLDIYAGSGALGLEALSRGAVSLIAVEKDRKACQVVKDNMARVTGALHREVQTTVLCQPAERTLGTLPAATVDLAFVDPPYDLDDDALIGILSAIPLADEGIAVVERSAKNATPSWPEGLIELSAKTYGDTVVYLLSR
jgi:RNA methyltransferase, RsmD family